MKRKPLLILIPVGLLALVTAWQGIRYWWLHGYSVGTRTGVLRKISTKGSPLCKYVAGEMALVGSNPMAPEIWHFTVDEEDPNGMTMKALAEAEKGAKPVTLSYRQDKGKWWACADTEYSVTGVK